MFDVDAMKVYDDFFECQDFAGRHDVVKPLPLLTPISIAAATPCIVGSMSTTVTSQRDVRATLAGGCAKSKKAHKLRCKKSI